MTSTDTTPAPGLGGPAVAEGEPIPALGVTLSEADLARAEREAVLHQLCYFVSAINDLAHETLAFAGILSFGANALATGLASVSLIAFGTFGVALQACAVIHPLVVLAQIASLALSVLAGSSQLRAYYRFDATSTWLLRASLIIVEFFFLFGLVTPHSVMFERPRIAPAHCSIDQALWFGSGGSNGYALPLQSLAIAVFTGGRCVVLGTLWLISGCELIFKSIEAPGTIPRRVCVHVVGILAALLHTIKTAAYVTDVLVFGIATADEVALRCVLFVSNCFRAEGEQRLYGGSTLGGHTRFTQYESPLKVALAHPRAPLLLSIVASVLGLLYGALYQQQKEVRRQRYLRATTVFGARAN